MAGKNWMIFVRTIREFLRISMLSRGGLRQVIMDGVRNHDQVFQEMDIGDHLSLYLIGTKFLLSRQTTRALAIL